MGRTRRRALAALALGMVLVGGLPSCATTKTEDRPVAPAEPCPEGLARTEDTAGRCCWPGQAWSRVREACVGQPTTCPRGMVAGVDRCEAPAASAMSDEAFEAAVGERVDAVLERPAVDGALDRMIGELTAEPELAGAGEAVLGSLGDAPPIAAAGAVIIEQLGQHPAMIGLVQRFIDEDPRRAQDPAALEAAMGAHFDAVFAGTAWNLGFDTAFEEFAASPEVDAAFVRLGQALTAGLGLEQRLTRFFANPRLEQRLAALNGGAAPDGPQSQDLLLRHVFTEPRLESFFIGFYSLPRLRRELAAALVGVLQSPWFRQTLATRLGRIMNDPRFAPLAVGAMVVLLEGTATADEVTAALRPLFALPATRAEIVGLVDDLSSHPSLAGPLQAAFGAAVADPEFEALLERSFLAGW